MLTFTREKDVEDLIITKPLIAILIVIVTLCGLIFMYSFLHRDEKKYTINSIQKSGLKHGIALSGMEDSQDDQNPILGENYTTNSEDSYTYFAQAGFDHIKLAFDWGALQPTLYGPLNKSYSQELLTQIEYARNNNLKVILDMHNFGRRGGEQNGVPIDGGININAFVDAWLKISELLDSDNTVIAYNLMTEPYNMPIPTTPDSINASSATRMMQEVVRKLREQGDTRILIVPLDQWSSAKNFVNIYGTNPKPWIDDPRVMYEAHYYLDYDGSGKYSEETDSPKKEIRSIRKDLTPFLSWCQKQSVLCYLGETGVPNTPAWQPYLAEVYSIAKEYKIPVTYWAAGKWYESSTGIQPKNNNFVTGQQNGEVPLQLTTIQNSF